MGLFLGKTFDGTLMGFPMKAHIGHCLQPMLGGWIQGGEGTEFQAVEEVFLHLAYAVFHPSLFIGLAHPAGSHRKTEVLGQCSTTIRN